MATYAYRCLKGHSVIARRSMVEGPPSSVVCTQCVHNDEDAFYAMRDYRFEAVEVDKSSLRPSEDGLFLPSQKDFERPGDPDGSRGVREWKDSHKPHETNKHPRWPSGGKRYF